MSLYIYIYMYIIQVMKQLELLEQRKLEDEDITDDIQFLMEKMESSVQVCLHTRGGMGHRPVNNRVTKSFFFSFLDDNH